MCVMLLGTLPFCQVAASAPFQPTRPSDPSADSLEPKDNLRKDLDAEYQEGSSLPYQFAGINGLTRQCIVFLTC